jgi:hypothetical protein
MEPIFNRINCIVSIGTCIAYVFQVILRVIGKRQRVLCNIHIALTIILGTLLFRDFYLHVPLIAIAANVHPYLDNYFSFFGNIFQLSFILLQALFASYFIIRLAQQRRDTLELP